MPPELTNRCFILCFVPGLKVLLLGIPDGFQGAQENWELCFLALIAVCAVHPNQADFGRLNHPMGIS